MKRITTPAAVGAAMLIILALAAITEAARPPRPPSGLSAAASVSPTVQFLNDTVGSAFTFTIRNTGTLGIGAVEVARPSTAWSVIGCPSAPTGWTTAATAANCRYTSASGSADNLAVGASSAAFQLLATTTGGAADRTGTWLVSVSSADNLADPTRIGPAVAEGTGLSTTAYAFEIVDAVIGTAAPGAPCPEPAPGDHDAFRGTSQTILICGRNRSTTADAPVARRSALGGTFVLTPGTFGAAPVPGTSAKVVMARWAGATIGDLRASGHSLTVKLASGNTRSTPPTRLDDVCPTPAEWCLANGGYKIANREPVAADDATFQFVTDEDTPFITPSVLDNDADADGDALSVASLDATATLGSVVSNGDGKFSYDPNGAFGALRAGDLAYDTFRYSVSDGFGGGASATVTITITGRDDPLDARDDAGAGFTTDEATPFTTGSVFLNDSYPGATPLFVSHTQPQWGSATYIGNGAFTFDPDGDFDALLDGETWTIPFTYTIGDGAGASDTATVTVAVSGRGHPPIAADDAAAGTEDDSLTIPVLANDTDPDGDPLTIDTLVQPALGAALIEGAAVKFIPGASFQDLAGGQSRTIHFEYKVADYVDGTDTASITVTVNGVNDVPVALDDAATTDEDAAVWIDVLANDLDVDAADDLAIAAVDGSLTVGALSIVDGQVRYDPAGAWDFLAPGEVGTTSFTYQAGDGNGGADWATVVVHVDGAEDPPIAADDNATTDEDTSVDIPVLDNDTDADDPMSIVAVGATSDGGVATINGSMITFVPNADFQDLQVGQSRASNFSYSISDGHDGTATATVTVVVTGSNDAPIGSPDTYRGYFNTMLTVGGSVDGPALNIHGSVLGNDSDVDDPAASLEVWPPGTFTTARGGSVSLGSNGQFTYVPAVTANTGSLPLSDSFGYSVRDAHGSGASATVTIQFRPEVIWYVSADAPLGGDGRSVSPFRSLQPLDSPDATADPDRSDALIFVQCSPMETIAVGDGFNLEPGQSLIGGSLGLRIGGDVLAAPGCFNPVIRGGVVVSDHTTIFGVDLGASGSAPASLSGGGEAIHVGGDALEAVSIDNPEGKALDLASTTGLVHLASLRSSNSASEGIRLVDAELDVRIGTGSITGAAGTDVEVVRGGGNFEYGGTIENTAGLAVQISGRNPGSGGELTFDGSITSVGAPGIALADNDASTVRFAGGLTLNTGAHAAFLATDGGAVSVTGWSNTIQTFGAPGLVIADTTIAPEGVTFRSISGNGNDQPGLRAIDLKNTGSSGRFAIATPPGTPVTVGSGGSLVGYVGTAIALRDTTLPAIEGLSLNGRIEAINVHGLSVRHSQWSGLILTDPTGTSTISNSVISRSFDDDIRWLASGGTADLVIASSTIGPTGTAGSAGDASIELEASGLARTNLTVVGSTIEGRSATGIRARASDGSSVALSVSGSTFNDNGRSIDLSSADAGDLTFDIVNNTFMRSRLDAVRVTTDRETTRDALVWGFIDGNSIGGAAVDSGSRDGRGIVIEADGDADGVVSVTGNTIRHVDQEGIRVRAFNSTIIGGGTQFGARLDVKVGGNSISDIDDNSTNEVGDPTPTGAVNGILLQAADDTVMCVRIGGDSSVGLGAAGIALRQFVNAGFWLEDFMGDGASDVEVEAFVVARSRDGTTAKASHQSPFVGVAPGSCRSQPG